ncbi:MAG TPA: hypothetical protein VFV92_13015 [Candidatus Bathyarchaeia archaeon]|nr:hypothetical protein [Candidatus Bathyarchaeia archaeon]
MNFPKIELSRKRGVIALIACGLVATSFILGGYVATGSWNPWGHRHYYQNLDVNFGYCVAGSQNFCNSVHNTMYNSGVAWIDQVIQGTTGTVTNGCFPSATCGMSFIALSGSAVTLAAGDASFGVTNGNCGAAGSEGGTEITAASGLQRAAATTNTLLSGATGSTSVLQKTFTSSATQTVQLACLVSYGTASNANSIQLAAATFTSVTLNSGDTIQITWTLTWSWS